MTDTYCYLHLRGQGNNTEQLQSALGTMLPDWRQRGMVPWGIWRGLFGVASNEALVMVAAADLHTVDEFTQSVGAPVQLLRAATFAPTVRPQGRGPCDRPGIYVFRFFTVNAADVNEFVELSTAAWTTFEDADSYAAQPMGLFREISDSEQLDMLLVTWYDSLQSWQTSRQFDANSRTQFMQRQKLTRSTVALATMLMPPATT